MVETVAAKLSKYLVSVDAAEQENEEVITYGLFLIFSSIIQIFILAVTSVILKNTTETIAFCICFASLKRYIGGAHANKHLTCLWGFTLLAHTSCFICRIIPGRFRNIVSIILAFIMLIIIIKKAPVAHPNNPVSNKKLKKMRKISLAVAWIQFTLIMFCALIMPEQAGLYLLCYSLGGISAAITLLL